LADSGCGVGGFTFARLAKNDSSATREIRQRARPPTCCVILHAANSPERIHAMILAGSTRNSRATSGGVRQPVAIVEVLNSHRLAGGGL